MESGEEGQRGWLRKLTSFFRRQPHQETSRKQDLGNEEQHGDSLQNENPKHANMRRLCPHGSQKHGLAGPSQSYSKVEQNVQLQNTIADLPQGIPIHDEPHTSNIVPEFRNTGAASSANATQGYNTYQQLPTTNIPPACAISENEQSDEMDVVEGVAQNKTNVEFRMDCSSTLFLTPSFDVQRALMGVVTPRESQLGNQSVPNVQSNKMWESRRESNVNEENLNEMQLPANDDVEQDESDLEEYFPAKMDLLSSSLESLSMTPTPLTETTSKPLKSILKRRRSVTFWDETVPFHGEDRQHQVSSATATSSSASFSGSNLVELNSSSQTLENNLNDGSSQGEDASVNMEPRTGSHSARPITEEYQNTRATPNDADLITNQNSQNVLNSRPTFQICLLNSTGDSLGIPVQVKFVNETNKSSADAGNENNSQRIEIILHEMGTSASDLENHSAETTSIPIFTSNEAPQNNPVVEFSHTETAIETETTTVGDAALSGVLLPRNNKIFQNFDTQMEVDISETDGESVGNSTFEDSDSDKDIVDRGSSSYNLVMGEHGQDSRETGPCLRLVTNGDENNEEEMNSQRTSKVGRGNQREDVNLLQTMIPTCSPIIFPESVTEDERERSTGDENSHCSSKISRVLRSPRYGVSEDKDIKNANKQSKKRPARTKKVKAAESDSDSDTTTEPKPKNGVPLRLPCSNCSKTFLRKKYLNCHNRVCHSDVRPFSCKICKTSFKRKGNLMDHMHLHNGNKPFSCVPCGKDFTLKSGLQHHFLSDTHLRLVQKKMDRDFKCTTCGKGFLTKRSLTAHLKIHSGARRSTCGICNKLFSRRSSMLTHIRLHTGETPYSCDQCGMRFARRDYLQKHLKTHKKERKSTDFRCEICGKSFASEGTLKMHMRVHTDTAIESEKTTEGLPVPPSNRVENGEEEINSQQIVGTRNLRMGANLPSAANSIPTDERPFKCEVCLKTFRLKWTWENHKKTHSGEIATTSVENE